LTEITLNIGGGRPKPITDILPNLQSQSEIFAATIIPKKKIEKTFKLAVLAFRSVFSTGLTGSALNAYHKW